MRVTVFIRGKQKVCIGEYNHIKQIIEDDFGIVILTEYNERINLSAVYNPIRYVYKVEATQLYKK